jgi:hypothetical protein
MAATELTLTLDEVDRLTKASEPRLDDYPYGAAGVAQRNRKLEGGR